MNDEPSTESAELVAMGVYEGLYLAPNGQYFLCETMPGVGPEVVKFITMKEARHWLLHDLNIQVMENEKVFQKKLSHLMQMDWGER